MDDSSRLQAGLANAEYRLSQIEKNMADVMRLLVGTDTYVIQTPSGIQGFNRQWRVPAMALGDVPTEEAEGGCDNLSVFTMTENNVSVVKVGSGQIGNTMIEEQWVGTVNSLKGQYIYALVTLNGTDGTYTAEVVNGSAEDGTGSDTETYLAIGYVDDNGAVSQLRCGPVFVNVCRNWFAAAAPFYGISVS